MDVLPAVEGGNHPLVSADVRQETKFNLRIVRVHEDITLGGYKCFSNLSALLCTHRNILHVGFRAGDAPCRGDALVKLRPHTVVRLADHVEEPVDKRTLELRDKAVFEDHRNGRMFVRKGFQRIRIGRKTTLVLSSCRQTKLFKKHFAELFRR
ncbi:hypothetical protein SDC9_176060 [bioreactor metagenome]|uniref:Uncharacterized protein n=1 Tax=bioreactor metagenome TaxID=1076179 RepID=A0A645GP28_9ZZZZ